jgi:hypothetical protein
MLRNARTTSPADESLIDQSENVTSTQPADLPVQAPVEYEVAKALGLKIPAPLLPKAGCATICL